MVSFAPNDRWYGGVLVLGGVDAGRYPDGNAFVVEGPEGRLLVDPSMSVFERGGAPLEVDAVVLSHTHEDHVPGLVHYRDHPVAVHERDHAALASLGGLMDAYGYEGELRDSWAATVVEEFHYQPRPDATTFGEGATWDLGGGRTMTALFLPGHTAGHCGFLVEPDGFFYLADIELTGFGPFYGDASSTLVGFEASLRRCAEVEARWYATFHHKGVIDDRASYLQTLSEFTAVIERRDAAMVAFLAQPHTLAELVAHRFVYRPHVVASYVDAAERRTAELHLERLVAGGAVVAHEDGTYQATA